MDDLIRISNLNDYLFCPFSIYLHSIYSHSNAEVETYQQVAQIAGKDAHASIDQKNYSTHSNVILSLSIVSYEFELIGVIDQLFVLEGLLVERKNKIHTVFLGQKMQLFAQYVCLVEMGYSVKKLKIYSIKDNKNYWIELPSASDLQDLKQLINHIQNFKPEKFDSFNISLKKCQNCIYSNLCPHKKEY